MKRERGTRTAHVQASTRALPLSRGKLPTLRRVDFVCGYLMKRNRYTLDWTVPLRCGPPVVVYDCLPD